MDSINNSGQGSPRGEGSTKPKPDPTDGQAEMKPNVGQPSPRGEN